MNIIETGLNAIRLPGVTNVLDEFMLLTAPRRRRYIIEMMRRVDSSLRAGILPATEKANLILYRGVA
jgi:hypothetical protein